MRCLYKDMQRSSKAYDESIFSITGLKKSLSITGFISTVLTLGVPLYKQDLGSFEEACKRFLRANPPCSVHAASLAKVFSQLADRQEVGGCSRETAFPGA